MQSHAPLESQVASKEKSFCDFSNICLSEVVKTCAAYHLNLNQLYTITETALKNM